MVTAPLGSNTYMRNEMATNNLLVDYSRSQDKFAVNRYVQIVPVDKMEGAYTEMVVEMAGAVKTDDGEDAYWPPGMRAPRDEGNLEQFQKRFYDARRYREGFIVDQLTNEQAPWNIVAQNSRHAVQRTMTRRTIKAVNLMTNSANMETGHVINIDSPPAGSGISGKLDVSTTSTMDIKATLDYAADIIIRSTLDAVDGSDIMFVTSPNVARRLGLTDEFRDHIKQSPFAKETFEGNLGPISQFGFPQKLYDYDFIVEKTVRVTGKKGGTRTKQYVMPDVIVAVSRVGELEGVEGSPSFSSVQFFMYEEMTVEDRYNDEDRMHEGRVVENYAVNLVGRLATVLIINPLT